jgi:hypothetical protein
MSLWGEVDASNTSAQEPLQHLALLVEASAKHLGELAPAVWRRKRSYLAS